MLDGVVRTESGHLADLERRTGNVRTLAREFGLELGPWPTGIAELCREVANDLFASCDIVDVSPAWLTAATTRVLEARAPARGGRENLTDCIVFEHCIGLLSDLRAAGATGPGCFVSSNTRDFGTPGPEELPVAAELAAVGATYETNIAAAAQRLGLV